MKKIWLKIHKITRERTTQRCYEEDRSEFFDAKYHGKAFQSSLRDQICSKYGKQISGIW